MYWKEYSIKITLILQKSFWFCTIACQALQYMNSTVNIFKCPIFCIFINIVNKTIVRFPNVLKLTWIRKNKLFSLYLQLPPISFRFLLLHSSLKADMNLFISDYRYISCRCIVLVYRYKYYIHTNTSQWTNRFVKRVFKKMTTSALVL